MNNKQRRRGLHQQKNKEDMDIGIARLFLNQSSDDSGHVKSSDLVFSDTDLLTLILVHLPSKKLVQFKCVSKSWLSLTATPYFKLQRSMITVPPRSGFFVQRPLNKTSHSDPVFYFPLQDEYNDSGMIRNLPTFCNHVFNGCGPVACRRPDSCSIRILDSSHGLLLCFDCYLGKFFNFKRIRDHYVYNPTTNQLATLPRTRTTSVCMTLAFRPSDSPHYKVLACAKLSQTGGLNPVRTRQFEIYSSETKSWRVSGRPFPQPYGMEFTGGVYCNGSVYWTSSLKPPEDGFADWWFFNLNEERLKKFPKPIICFRSISSSYFGESNDHLHFIKVDLHATSLHVYELKCDHSQWYVRYGVDLAQLSKAYSQMINNLHYDEVYYKVVVLSLVRRHEFVEGDSFLVLKMPGKVVRYNLVNGSLEEIFEHMEVIDQSKPFGEKIWHYVECRSSV